MAEQFELYLLEKDDPFEGREGYMDKPVSQGSGGILQKISIQGVPERCGD